MLRITDQVALTQVLGLVTDGQVTIDKAGVQQ